LKLVGVEAAAINQLHLPSDYWSNYQQLAPATEPQSSTQLQNSFRPSEVVWIVVGDLG